MHRTVKLKHNEILITLKEGFKQDRIRHTFARNKQLLTNRKVEFANTCVKDFFNKTIDNDSIRNTNLILCFFFFFFVFFFIFVKKNTSLSRQDFKNYECVKDASNLNCTVNKYSYLHSKFFLQNIGTQTAFSFHMKITQNKFSIQYQKIFSCMTPPCTCLKKRGLVYCI